MIFQINVFAKLCAPIVHFIWGGMEKMKKIALLGTLVLVLFLAACGGNEKAKEESNNASTNRPEEITFVSEAKNEKYSELPQFTDVQDGERVVVMETTKGNIHIKLFPEYAPKTVENFVTHAENGYYDGLSFHRVIKDFMIQGGDPTGTGAGGESIWGTPFEDEFTDQLWHFRGALSMANAGANTNGSQFFIVQLPSVSEDVKKEIQTAQFPETVIEAYTEVGGTPFLDNRHTVFGHVIKGMDIVDQIANAEVDGNDKPKEDIIIKTIHVMN